MIKKWIATVIVVICSFLGIYDYGEEQIAQGYELMNAGEYATAEEQFEAALVQAAKMGEKKSDEEAERYVVIEAYRGLGLAAYEQKEYQNCIEYLQRAMDEGTEPTIIMYQLMGNSAMQLEDYETALIYFNQGCEFSENDEEFKKLDQEIRYNKIVCYEQLADWESARTEAEEYITLYPDDEKMQKEYTFLKTR